MAVHLDLTGVTVHAEQRAGARRLGVEALEAAFAHGRVVYARGARIYAIGRKEVASAARHAADLRAFEGVQVLCSPDGRTVITAYRNRDFRGLRSRRRPARGRRKERRASR